MKRSNTKELNILTAVIVLSLAFLCIFNITYSYFTASSIINGDVGFNNIKVNFYYTTATTNGLVENGNTLVVNSVGTVTRGTPFAIQYGGQEFTSIGLKADSSSCAVYIRFWIDAYALNDGVEDTTINYGKYFALYKGANPATDIKYLPTYDGENITYFISGAVSANGVSDTFNKLMLKDDAPNGMLGKNISITIKFEAIQATNGACKAWEMYLTDENGNDVLDEDGFQIVNDNKGIINNVEGLNNSLKWNVGV